MQVIAHSVGCWNAFEFLQLARERGLRMPAKVFFSAMAAPTIPRQSRPWREQHTLSETQFKVKWLLAKVEDGASLARTSSDSMKGPSFLYTTNYIPQLLLKDLELELLH